jgi:hypothetical protein
LGQAWEVCQNFSFGHAARQVLEDVIDGDAGSSDARFAASHIWCDGDTFEQVHAGSVAHFEIRIFQYKLIARETQKTHSVRLDLTYE